MSTQTSALPDGTTLTKPASGEKVSLSVINTNTDNIANNIILLKSNIDKASHANITGISATGDSNFIIALMTKLNTTYSLSSQSVGVTISGRAEWSGIDYLNFVASKAAPTGWNVLVTGANRIITAYYNASNNSVSSINEVYDKIFPLGYAQTISSATDFNTLLDIKNYVISSNSVASESANCPSSNAGKLCTWSIDGGSFDRTWAYGGQIYIDIPGREFRRQVTTNGSKVLNFGTWQQLTISSQIVRFWDGSVTTDSNGRFNANSTINVAGASKPVILGITCSEAWYHFRLYHGSNYNTMVQVTDYNADTPKPNVTLNIRIAYTY